jgi:hypothetical protein
LARSELRVHGVSGTPPRDLLYSDPVSYDRSDPYAQVYEQSRDGPEVKAFHWGSLTSGSRITAFWILLSPFMLSNVAGWMAASRPVVHAFIRVAGLGMSGLFVAQGLVVTVDLTNQMFGDEGYGRVAIIGGALLLVAAYTIVVWRLSTRSLLSPMDPSEQMRLLFGLGDASLSPARMTAEERRLHAEDPARGARLFDPSMWVRQKILHRLRRQHLAMGLAVAALGVELGLDHPVQSTLAYVLLLLVAVDTFLNAFPGHRPTALVRRVAAPSVHVGLILFVAALIGIGLGPLPPSDKPWPGLHRLVFFVAVGAGIGALGAYIAQARARHKVIDRDAFLPLSALAIGLLIGGALGVAAAVLAELMASRFLPDLSGFGDLADFDLAETQVMANGGAWTTVAMLCFVMGLAAIAGFAAWSGSPELPEREGRTMAMLRRVTRRAGWVFGVAGMLASVLAVMAAAIMAIRGWDPARLRPAPEAMNGSQPEPATGPMDPEILPWVALAIFVVMILALTGVTFLISKAGAPAVPVLGAAVLWAGWYSPFDDDVFRIPLVEMPMRPTRLLDISFLVIVLGLAYFILRSILGGLGDPERRRKVGMIWDIGSFWPRWFHPLAPPAYGPHAVKSLARALDSQSPRVLAAHSQGSVISTVTLATQRCKTPTGLVTYGSPLGILYAKLFPDVGVDGLIEGVESAWPGRHWVNLWRNTDPLGGEPLPGMEGNRLVCSGTGHSQYELTFEFDSARTEAVGGLSGSVSPRDVDLDIDPCR